MHLNEFEIVGQKQELYIEDYYSGEYSCIDFLHEGRLYRVTFSPGDFGYFGSNTDDELGAFNCFYSSCGTVCKEFISRYFSLEPYLDCPAITLEFDPFLPYVSKMPWFFYRLPWLAKFFCQEFGGIKKILYGLKCFQKEESYPRFPEYLMLQDSIFDIMLSPFAVLLADGSVFCYDASDLSTGIEFNEYLAYCLKCFANCFLGDFNASQVVFGTTDYSDQLSLRWNHEVLHARIKDVSDEIIPILLDEFIQGRDYRIREGEVAFVDASTLSVSLCPILHYIFNSGKFFCNLDQFESYSRRSVWGEWLDRSNSDFVDLCNSLKTNHRNIRNASPIEISPW